MTARQLYDHITRMFKTSGFDDPRFEAASLLKACLGLTRERLLTHPETPVDEKDCQTMFTAADQRCAHLPLAYLAGSTVFFNLDFQVGPGVLIPRADSEVLVESALECLKTGAFDANREKDHPCRVLDLFTGSGCIGISIAAIWRRQFGPCQLDLVDIDEAACACASDNLAQHQLQDDGRVIQANLFPPMPLEPYDLITANPPYIPTDQIQTLMPEVRLHEPALALDGGTDGLDFYRRVIGRAPDYLRDSGWLVLEHGYDQPDPIAGMFHSSPVWHNLFCRHDYGGQARVTGAQIRKQA